MAPIRRIEPQVDAFFLLRPKAPYGVRRLARSSNRPDLRLLQPAHRRRPAGTYYFNGSSSPTARS